MYVVSRLAMIEKKIFPSTLNNQMVRNWLMVLSSSPSVPDILLPSANMPEQYPFAKQFAWVTTVFEEV
ncbi:hypothetical protein DPMN_042294 [Dreissena polymorpha]|uniref:Uncharacterized protein n=1 Tax=Dreissena polymorpha TaxID=45954 RepID=A0A9D4HWT5_DREPO|nr:hypothetical protein DPMN_042294 [Dreissena polymorpha]